MILPVYLYNHSILREKTNPLNDMNDETQQFIANMFETMAHANGIGLAANQVGDNRSIIVVDITDPEDDEPAQIPPTVFINPVIEKYSEDLIDYEEGCLSVPKFRDKVFRPDAVRVKYLDKDMNEKIIDAEGILARVLQHEIDHLNGIYFFDRLSAVRKTLAQGKLRKIMRGDIIPDYDYTLGDVKS